MGNNYKKFLHQSIMNIARVQGKKYKYLQLEGKIYTFNAIDIDQSINLNSGLKYYKQKNIFP